MHRALVGATLAAAFVGVTVLAQSTTPASTSAPLTPILGGAPITSGALDIRSLLVSFLGAVVLLALVNLVRFHRAKIFLKGHCHMP